MLKYERDHYERLVGYTVASIGEDDEGFPALLLTHETLEPMFAIVSQDPEGNGPGWLFVEEVAS